MEAVAIIMFQMGDAVITWMFDEIARMDGHTELHEWLRATIRKDKVEMSGMVWLFEPWADRTGEKSDGAPYHDTEPWTL